MKTKKLGLDTRITITVKGVKVTAPAYMLNLLSLYAGEAAEKFSCEGFADGLGLEAREVRDEIYEQLEAKGLYN